MAEFNENPSVQTCATVFCEQCKTAPGRNICGKCKEIGIAHSSIGRYCSRECQVAAHETHKHLHTLVKSAQNDCNNRAAPHTIVLALVEASILNKLPALKDNVLSILIVGCREWIEGQFRYDCIYTYLKQLNIYPDLQRVDITLVGPEVSNQQIQQYSTGNYSLTMKKGTLEAVYPNLTSSCFSLAVVPQPGLSDFLKSWTPAFKILVKSNLLTITTGYSSITHWSMDGVFDEINLKEYFGANILLPRTRNAAAPRVLLTRGAHSAIPFAFYIIFQGASEDATLTYDEAIRRNQILFVTWLGEESTNYEDNKHMGAVCQEIVNSFAAGDLELKPNTSHKQLESALQQMAFERMMKHERR